MHKDHPLVKPMMVVVSTSGYIIGAIMPYLANVKTLGAANIDIILLENFTGMSSWLQ